MDSDIAAMTDINDLDLSTVETDFPLLASGIAVVQVQSCALQPADDKKQGSFPYLEIKFALTQPHQTAAGEGRTVKTINPGDRGSSVNHRIYYGVSYKKKEEGTKFGYDAIAKFREAVFGKATAGTKFSCDEMLGQQLSVRLLFEAHPQRDGTEYGPRTTVADFIRKAR